MGKLIPNEPHVLRTWYVVCYEQRSVRLYGHVTTAIDSTAHSMICNIFAHGTRIRNPPWIRSLNFNQWVTAAGSKVDPTIARADLNKRHVRFSFFLSSLLQFLESHCFVRSWVSLCSILSLIASVALLMLSVSSLYRSLIFSLLLMCLYSPHVVMWRMSSLSPLHRGQHKSILLFFTYVILRQFLG